MDSTSYESTAASTQSPYLTPRQSTGPCGRSIAALWIALAEFTVGVYTERRRLDAVGEAEGRDNDDQRGLMVLIQRPITGPLLAAAC